MSQLGRGQLSGITPTRFRSISVSRPPGGALTGLLSATSRPEQVQQTEQAYSITSSASASSLGGTSIPSAFAILRLMLDVNFVGCSMGMSPGLVPLRILVDEIEGAAKDLDEVHAVTSEATILRQYQRPNRREMLLCGERGDGAAVVDELRVAAHRALALLGARCHGPSRRTAQQCDELATLQSIVHPVPTPGGHACLKPLAASRCWRRRAGRPPVSARGRSIMVGVGTFLSGW
jgi:hypothetical protein